MKHTALMRVIHQAFHAGLGIACAALICISCKNQDEINLHMQKGNALFNYDSYTTYDQALDHYRAVYGLDHKHFEALSRMGFLCAVLVGEYGAPSDLLKEGRQYIGEAGALNQKSALSTSAKALLSLYGKGDMDDTVRLLKNALAGDPESSLLHTTLGYVLLRQGNFLEASEEFTKGIRPAEIRPIVGLGLTALYRGRYNEAAAFFSQVLANDGNHTHSIINKGLVALLRGNTAQDTTEVEDALRKLNLAREGAASFVEKRIARFFGIMLTIRGANRAKGFEQLTAFLAKENDGVFFSVAAREYRRYGMLAEATTAIRKALSADPNRPGFLIEEAAIALASKNYETARTRALRLHAKDPANIESLIIVGDTYLVERNFSNALEYFTQAKDDDPGYALAYARIGTTAAIGALIGKEASYANCLKYLQLDPRGEFVNACQKVIAKNR